MSDEHNADEMAEAKNKPSVNRRSFVKALGGAGGAAVASGMFASRAQAASSRQSPSMKQEMLTGDDLEELSRDVAGREDMKNVMNSSRREIVQTGSAVETSQKSQPGTQKSQPGIVFTQGARSEAKENGIGNLQAGTIFVSAARHTLKNGDRKLAVAYLTEEDHVIGYIKIKKREGGFSEKVKKLAIINDGNDPKLSVEQESYNGAEPRPISEVEISEASPSYEDPCPPSDPCGGCHPGHPGGGMGEHSKATCNGNIDIDCVLSGYACYGCKYACLYGPQSCAVCLVVSCGLTVLYSCCVTGGVTHSCVNCGCGSCC